MGADGTQLDLHDIQGNIIKAYPRFGLPKGRYLFLRVLDGEAGREFISRLMPLVTTSAPWVERGRGKEVTPPGVTTNVAFTFQGLARLGVPQASLQSFPEEFAMGMRARREILGDDGPSAPEYWDPIWNEREPVHIFVAITAASPELITERYVRITGILAELGRGVELSSGHRADEPGNVLPYQDASALYEGGVPTAKEHFGFTDGISDPFYKGAETHSSNVIGGGKVTGQDVETAAGWEPLETGEFLLGQRDEAFELPPAPIPRPLADNGTFLVYRKLHENVGSFDRYLDSVGAEFPGGKEALAAKFAGRWRNGAPVTTFRSEHEANQFAAQWAAAKLAVAQAKNAVERAAAKQRFSELNTKFVAFDYRKDPTGSGCPMGSHARRVHPRAALEYGVSGAFERPDALANRRRIIRRGLPYGDSARARDDRGNHGIIFMAIGASIRRQFEFVQQQWINYGNDFRLANDKDPLLGNHGTLANGTGDGRMVIETDAGDPRPPFFCAKLPRFVETRGGDYFFVPSITALRMIADGIVDPT
jgi:Dyp-type peroxidase family